MGVSVTCSKCGQPFTLQEAAQSAEQLDLESFDNEPDEQPEYDDDFEPGEPSGGQGFDIAKLTRGLQLLTLGWCGCLVSSFVMILFFAATRMSDDVQKALAPFTLLFGMATAALMLSGALFVIGQACCLFSHDKGSVARSTMGRSLRSWGVASVCRAVGLVARMPVLKTVGSFIGASALERFLGYLSIVALQVGQPLIAMRVVALRKMFYRSLMGVIGIGLLLMTGVVPVRASLVLVILLVLGLLVTYLIFGIRLALVLFALSKAARQHENVGYGY